MTRTTRSVIVLLTVLCVSAATAFGQTLVSSASNGILRQADINGRISAAFGSYSVGSSASDIELTAVTYTSTDEDGKPINLTGLLAYPTSGAPKGLVVACHGTTQDRNASPSRWKGEAAGSETETAVYAFATGGYAVILPDYIGLGDSKLTHPYPRNKINAQSAVDIIAPARALARQKQYNIGSKLYITGYSEGGGVAMATTKQLQETMSGAEYRVEASAPASGPYDVKNATRQFMLVQPTDQTGFVVRVYLLAYAAFYLRKHSNIPIRNYFKPLLADSIWLSFNAKLKDADLVKRLGITTVLMRSKNDLRNVITPRFLNALQTLDSSDPLVAALMNDDVYDWAPRTRMLLINLDGDFVVTPDNTTNAYNAMRRRGVTAATMRRYVIRDASLNHVTAVPAAMSAARKFFDDGFQGVPAAQ